MEPAEVNICCMLHDFCERKHKFVVNSLSIFFRSRERLFMFLSIFFSVFTNLFVMKSQN